MTKVLFIYPSLNAQEGFNHGLAALSGALKAAGAETKLLHLNEGLYGPMNLEEIERKVVSFDPHLVCISVMSQQFKYAVRIARALKERFPYPIALGGVHATMIPEEAAALNLFDYIGLGECDDALPALADALRNEKNTAALPNFWIRSEKGYIRNPVGPLPDLEKLAPVDYELFDLDHMLPRMNGWMSIITSRGCPHRCSYCFNHKFVDRYRREANIKPAAYLRRYPIGRIIEDMNRLKARHPAIRTFIFDDDLFTLSEDYVLEFCQAYRERGPGLPFVVNGHVRSFTAPMARALREAGCKILKFGVESGSERIRRAVLNRPMGNGVIQRAFEIAHEAGLHTSAFIMIGLPLEERADLDDTIDLLARIGPGRFRWAVFYPFPGTQIHRLCEEKGLLDPQRMKDLDNFYEASPLRLDPDAALRVDKLQRCLHWYVCARSPWESAPLYRDKVREIEALDAEAWRVRAQGFLEEDRRLSAELASTSKRHYSIRFIQVMAVRSDYQEEEAADFSRPVKEWKSAKNTLS